MNNNFILNRLFTRNIFGDLIVNDDNEVYKSLVSNYTGETLFKDNYSFISFIYKYMQKNYRNEYFYQNTLFNKLVLGRHSINTTTALTQLSVGRSKADFVMINGKAVVYEIKTELDNFERLENQILDYYKAFGHVYLITCENNYEKASEVLKNTPVGISILSNKNTIKFPKPAIEEKKYLEYRALFKILRKKEFENILKSYFGKVPDVTPVFYYNACFELFEKIPIAIAHSLVIKELKKRASILKYYYNQVPYELKFLMYFFNAKEIDYINLFNFLQKKIREDV